MARTTKAGISYYTMESDFMSDMKIRRIMSACGASSIAVLLHLLGNIYGDDGYFMRWNEDIPFLIADSLVGVNEGQVREVIVKALQVGFFNQKLFDEYQILTSKGIQKRYAEATARRKNSNIDNKYCLLNVYNNKENVSNKGLDVYNNGLNVYSEQQKRREEKRGEERRREYSRAREDTLSLFEQFFNAYPNQSKKDMAAGLWMGMDIDQSLFDEIMAGLSKWKSSDQWNRDGGRFIHAPTTFLMEKLWLDNPPQKIKKAGEHDMAADDLSDAIKRKIEKQKQANRGNL